jgi:enhancing lycopene biosynthesis protein 2
MGQKHGIKHTTGEQITGNRNVTIREIMEVGKNILEVTEEKGYGGLDM